MTPAEQHDLMHGCFTRIKSLWVEYSRPITADDLKKGWTAEVLRWARDKLGGRDEDLIGPERWGKASRDGWSVQATYSCLPRLRPSWPDYVHEVGHYVWLMLPGRFGSWARNHDSHSLEQSQLELELTELVAGWLADEARGIERTFPELQLSRPPDLRWAATKVSTQAEA